MAPPAPMLDEPSAENEVADPRRRRFILIAMCTALVAVVASVSGLNVAQAELATDLGASQAELLWVINGYTIALAALLMPIGAIGDRWGRKKVLVAGLVLFVAANVAAAFAGDVDAAARLPDRRRRGAAMIMPVTLSVITSSFPAEDRDRAVGVWAGFAGAGGILGLVGSSIVVDNFTWPWVFAVPVVLAAVALAMTVAFVPHSREHSRAPLRHRRLDPVGRRRRRPSCSASTRAPRPAGPTRSRSSAWSSASPRCSGSCLGAAQGPPAARHCGCSATGCSPPARSA